MKFISDKELTGKSSEVWRKLNQEHDLVITRKGKPVAIISATDEASFEQSLEELRRTRAMRATRIMQQQAQATSLDQLTPDQISEEIKATRQERDQ